MVSYNLTSRENLKCEGEIEIGIREVFSLELVSEVSVARKAGQARQRLLRYAVYTVGLKNNTSSSEMLFSDKEYAKSYRDNDNTTGSFQKCAPSGVIFHSLRFCCVPEITFLN